MLHQFIFTSLVLQRASELTRNGELVVTSSASRYQLMNRADCLIKLRERLWRFESEREAAVTRERAEVLSCFSLKIEHTVESSLCFVLTQLRAPCFMAMQKQARAKYGGVLPERDVTPGGERALERARRATLRHKHINTFTKKMRSSPSIDG